MKEGWEVKELGEVCVSLHQGLNTAGEKVRFYETGYPIIQTRNIEHGVVDLDHKIKFMCEEDWLKYKDKYQPEVGDVFFTNIGTIGKTAIVSVVRDFLIHWNIFKLRPDNKRITAQYLKYTLEYLTLSGYFKNLQKGGTVDFVTKQMIASALILLPPLPEQQRIVAILDDAFESIAIAKANAEKNLQNAKALFESYLQGEFATAWQVGDIVTLADLATDITDGDHMPPPKAPSGVPFITIGNVAKDTRIIDFSDTFMVSNDYFNKLKPNKKPRKGDVLYTVTGSFGIPVLIAESRDFCFQRHIGLIRPKSDVDSVWLYYLLLSPQVFKQASDGATGTAQKTVSLKLLRGFQVPRIPLDFQQTVAAKLNLAIEETQRLESLYQQKITALDELKKALLHQAFSGQL